MSTLTGKVRGVKERRLISDLSTAIYRRIEYQCIMTVLHTLYGIASLCLITYCTNKTVSIAFYCKGLLSL